jgi:hypothetical protein
VFFFFVVVCVCVCSFCYVLLSFLCGYGHKRQWGMVLGRMKSREFILVTVVDGANEVVS